VGSPREKKKKRKSQNRDSVVAAKKRKNQTQPAPGEGQKKRKGGKKEGTSHGPARCPEHGPEKKAAPNALYCQRAALNLERGTEGKKKGKKGGDCMTSFASGKRRKKGGARVLSAQDRGKTPVFNKTQKKKKRGKKGSYNRGHMAYGTQEKEKKKNCLVPGLCLAGTLALEVNKKGGKEKGGGKNRLLIKERGARRKKGMFVVGGVCQPEARGEKKKKEEKENISPTDGV